MEKSKEKADLEQLLNSLIEKGWTPRGEKVNKVIRTGIDEFGDGYVLFDGELNGYNQRGCNMTELVSKSSGLWQFVCENGMIEPYKMDWIKNLEICSDKMEVELNYGSSYYEAWLIESSLKDESELEEFLLSSISLHE